jgi:hypothetical protein
VSWARPALTAAFALLCASVTPDSLAGQCTLGKIVEFPITMVGLRPQMTAKVNGADVRFMVDSGAFFSVISPASAAELNLVTRPTPIEFLKLVGSCSKMAPVYWVAKSGADYSVIDIESRERTSSAIGHASINGTDIRVLFDSGAGVSTLTLKAAARAGIRP